MPDQASTDQSGKSTTSIQVSLGLSEFIGRVLGQLSLSAWLPGAMLVGVGSLLAELHSQAQLDLGTALVKLTRDPLGILVVLVFALILATVITQAFEFEAIRFLEGYWGANRVGIKLAGARIASHVRASTTAACCDVTGVAA